MWLTVASFFASYEKLSLCEQIHYRLSSSAYEGGTSAAFGMKALLDVHAHGGRDRGVEILWFELRVRFSAFFIGGSYGLAAFNSAAG
jgi:hypothetical protein